MLWLNGPSFGMREGRARRGARVRRHAAHRSLRDRSMATYLNCHGAVQEPREIRLGRVSKVLVHTHHHRRDLLPLRPQRGPGEPDLASRVSFASRLFAGSVKVSSSLVLEVLLGDRLSLFWSRACRLCVVRRCGWLIRVVGQRLPRSRNCIIFFVELRIPVISEHLHQFSTEDGFTQF